MATEDKSNISKGRTSYDADIQGQLVNFFNRNVSEYPTDVGGPAFDLVPVTKQKDIMLNVARLHAQQEYDRIMQLVAVLQKQAAQIKRRLEITDAVHSAEYQFQIYHNQCYWLVFHHQKQKMMLYHHGPNDSLVTENVDFIARVKWLGDYSWTEVDQDGNSVW